jgi:hypothetical protein
MSRGTKQSDDPFAADGQAPGADDLRASFERSQSLERQAIEERYGPDVRLLAEDDDKLLTYLESDDLSRKQVALLCLLHFHTVYPDRMVSAAADYVVSGDDLGIRSLCVRYLGRSRNDKIISILRYCAAKIEARDARPGDDAVLRFAVSCLGLAAKGPRPIGEIASMAEEILARLRLAREQDVSGGRPTPSPASENHGAARELDG